MIFLIFSSIEFLLWFLPIFLIVYGITPRKYRNLTLLVGSIVFYARGDVRYLPLLMISILCNYFLGLHLAKRSPKTLWRKKLLLILTLGANLAVLLWFKDWGGSAGLPLGISFYTFQTLSYTIDVYRREVKTEHNIIDFGAYVVMFPQLIAGPIVKYRDVSAQLHVYKHRYSLQQIEEGMTLFTFGLAKKVLLADAVGALWTDIIGIADSPSTTFVGLANASTPLVWLGVIAYSLQLYFDFSGYSLMGIGMGKMLGFDFPQNFNYPYISRSITEFWRRWHISLSTWFRDYVYIPLGGSKKGEGRTYLNLLVVWLFTGLWHGSTLNFLLWGLFLFALISLERLGWGKVLRRSQVISRLYMLLVIPLSWMLFAIPSLKDIGSYIGRLFAFSGGTAVHARDFLVYGRQYAVVLVIGLLVSTPLPEKLWRRIRTSPLGTVLLLVLFWVCVYCMAVATNDPFMYFSF